jgi:hypothetical protein
MKREQDGRAGRRKPIELGEPVALIALVQVA